MRYQLEKALINDELQVDELPLAWQDYTEKLLGIKPGTDSEGCLQDIHWPSGIFGYFPSYSIGAIMAAQFFATIQVKLPKVNDLLAKGDFYGLTTWLSSNIHCYGSRYSPQELITKVTGEGINLDHYKKYLYKKFITNYQ
jgi:carboxypeptidase Taq